MTDVLNIQDVLIYEGGDGGELQLRNEDIQTSQSLTNQVYLALFGGNLEENTSEELEEKERRKDWWGNYYLDREHQFNSIFERTLSQVALNSSGVSRLEDAARKDLDYLSDYVNIEVSGSIPAPHRFELDVNIQQPDKESVKLKFVWDSQRKEFYQQGYV